MLNSVLHVFASSSFCKFASISLLAFAECNDHLFLLRINLVFLVLFWFWIAIFFRRKDSVSLWYLEVTLTFLGERRAVGHGVIIENSLPVDGIWGRV